MLGRHVAARQAELAENVTEHDAPGCYRFWHRHDLAVDAGMLFEPPLPVVRRGERSSAPGRSHGMSRRSGRSRQRRRPPTPAATFLRRLL